MGLLLQKSPAGGAEVGLGEGLGRYAVGSLQASFWQIYSIAPGQSEKENCREEHDQTNQESPQNEGAELQPEFSSD